MGVPAPQTHWALFLDFDGTLVDFADTPDAVRVDPYLLPKLQRIEKILDGALAVITGRRISEIDRFLGRSVALVAGLHGFECRLPDGQVTRVDLSDDELDSARQEIKAYAAHHPELVFEDKGFSIALHYRKAPHLGAECRALVNHLALRSNGRFEVLEGRMVAEMKIAGIDKGDAVHRYMALPAFRGRHPVFVGDDVTDEFGFAAAQALGGIGVIVGDRTPSVADWRVRDVEALISWLTLLSGDGEAKQKG